MAFVHATITVNNMEESVKFYQDVVKLDIDRRISPESGPEIVFLGDGETKVELIHYGQEEKVNLGKDIALGFLVDSLEEKMDFVKEMGIAIHSGPFQPNPSTRFFMWKTQMV